MTEADPTSPHRYLGYGRYQLTVAADATTDDISALLPDTLPVDIHFKYGPNCLAIGTVDCPVTWKPLSLPRLAARESITIPDAAEEILVPAGTLVSTPLGIFQLDEPLSLNTPPTTDEVRLVLNTSPEDSTSTGVLREERDGLKIALTQKPTGATSIQAYILTEGESEWSELPGLSLLEEMNAPFSSANSGYALVLRTNQEPYRSYLEAETAGETPVPFYIGLKIEGGIYDGQQFILAWPDIYETLPDLPKLSGAGGNEGNAGAGNQGDSTPEGQRPNLPQTPDEQPEEQGSDWGVKDSQGEQQPVLNTESSSGEQRPDPSGENEHEEQRSDSDTDTENGSWEQPPNSSQSISADTPAESQKNNPFSASFVVHAAEDKNETPNIPVLPNEQLTTQQTAVHGNRTPLLLVTAAAVAGCIGTIAGKAVGYRLLHRTAAKIRHILHR